MQDQPVFIVGIPRSGTSMVAGMLEQMGVWAGETVGPSPANPKGFYENTVLRENVNKRILETIGCDPLGVRGALPDWTEDVGLIPQDGMREAILKLIAAQGYTGGPWLFKDCKTLLLAPLWWRAFPEAKWIICYRKPHDVIASCLKTSFMAQHSHDPAFWNHWILEHHYRLDSLWTACDAMEIWPQKLAEGDYSELQAIAEWVGIEYREPVGFFDAEHWHGSKDGDEPLLSTVMHNTKRPELLANVDHALSLGLPQLDGPADYTAQPVCIVAGGPSVRGKIKRIKRMQKAGAKITALNGSHDYLLRNGIVPDAMVMMDARAGEHNRFLSKARPGVRYYLASQCAPDAFDAVEGYDVMLWHSDFDGLREHIADRDDLIVLGGCTVGLRALNIELLNGHREIHLFGFDSCVWPDRHHAYPQPQNDNDKLTKARWGDREFTCTVWQARQVQDFQVQMEALGSKVIITIETPPPDVLGMIRQAKGVLVQIHGDGLLAEMIRHGRKQKDAA